MLLIVLAVLCFVVAVVGPGLIRIRRKQPVQEELQGLLARAGQPGLDLDAPRGVTSQEAALGWLLRTGTTLLGGFLLGLTSWTVIGDQQVGHLKRI